MTITAAYCPLSLTTLFDANGYPQKGGQVYVYDAETTNPRPAYSDPALTTPYTSPVLTNAFGRIPKIYIGLGAYKVVLKDAAGSLIDTIDDIPGGVQFFDSPATPSGWNTGDMKFAHTSNVQDGWLVANGNTIGNQSSAATARANSDTQPLFTSLWNSDASLVVSGGRGTTATADYAASKTIALPDYRGRLPCGVDQMGASLTAGTITTFSSATPNQVGARFGSEGASISPSQLPAFAPTITIVAAGGHTHTGTTDSQGAHVHGGTTDVQGSHSHTYQRPNTSFYGYSGGGQSFSTDQYSTSTGAAGAHSHNITTDSQGAHIHNVSLVAVADHIHNATCANLGTGANHANIPPVVLGFWHIRL